MDFRRNFHAIKIFIFKLSLKRLSFIITYSPSWHSKHAWLFGGTWTSIFWRMLATKQFWWPLTCLYGEKNKQNISPNTFLYSAEEMINDDRILIFVGAFPQSKLLLDTWYDWQGKASVQLAGTTLFHWL